jgi:hypothetical protein
MTSRSSKLACWGAAILALYVAPYLYYSRIRDDSVDVFVGGVVHRPSIWRALLGEERTDFTFDASSRSMGGVTLNKSFVTQNLVSWLCEKTHCDFAEAANIAYYPAARVDHLFNGRYIVFRNFYNNMSVLPFPTRSPGP